MGSYHFNVFHYMNNLTQYVHGEVYVLTLLIFAGIIHLEPMFYLQC